MKKFKDFGIFFKIMSIPVSTSVVLIMSMIFILVPFIRQLIIKEKQTNVTNLVQEAISVVATLGSPKRLKSSSVTSNIRSAVRRGAFFAIVG